MSEAITIIPLENISLRLASNSQDFNKIRCLIVNKIDSSTYKAILDRFKVVELESHRFSSKTSQATFCFFDYALMHYAISLLNDLSQNGNYDNYEYEIGEKDIPYNYLLAYQAGASRHIFISNPFGESINTLAPRNNENKRNFVTEFKLKHLETSQYNEDKKIHHFKFTEFDSALDFAFKLQNTNLKFGFQRKKSEKLFSNLRTIYLGNINCSPKDVLKEIWGGEIFQLKFLKEKNVAFLTFINPQSAEMFLKYYNTSTDMEDTSINNDTPAGSESDAENALISNKRELLINNKPCKVMPGNTSNINLNNIMEIARGATRLLKITKNENSTINKSVSETIDKIKREFTLVGIDLNDNEDCIDIECLSIQDAVSIKEMFFNVGVSTCEFVSDICGAFNAFEGMLLL
ncbi:Negative regulator of differentiation 1 [Cucumispora dikerogammari]|nr:Negative regulator of differentiation 1 [Cucumispora dikerogammari]